MGGTAADGAGGTGGATGGGGGLGGTGGDGGGQADGWGSCYHGWNSDQFVATTVADDVVVAGTFRNDTPLDFGGGPLFAPPFDEDVYVARLGDDGSHVWSHSFGSTSSFGTTNVLRSLAVDTVGNSIVTGSFIGTLDFGGPPVVSAVNAAFFAKLAADGSHTWSFSQPGCGADLAVDPMDSVIVAGDFQSTVDFGGGPLVNTPGAFTVFDVFVAKLAPDGSHVWSASYGDASSQHVFCVASDAAGSIAVLGYSDLPGVVDFGGGPLPETFVVVLNADGDHVWSRSLGGWAGECSAVFDSAGNLLITGEFADVDFGGGELGDGSTGPIVVAKLDPSGDHIWSKSIPSTGNIALGEAISVDSTDNVVLAGRFSGNIDFGGGLYTSSEGSHFFAAGFASDGSYLWAQVLGGPDGSAGSLDQRAAVAVNSGDNVLIAGTMEGAVDFGEGPVAQCGLFVTELSP